MILNRDEDVSRRGYVAVIYSMCHSYRNQEDQAKELFDITQWNMQRTALPERIVACHWCYESPQAAIDVQIGRVLMGRKYRLRTRTFCCNGGDGGGNDPQQQQLPAAATQIQDRMSRSNGFLTSPSRPEAIDLSFQLQTYGIPVDETFPINNAGDLVTTSFHVQWIQMQRQREGLITHGVQHYHHPSLSVPAAILAAAEARPLLPDVADDNDVPSTSTTDAGMDAVIEPRRFDVLFGKGKITTNWTGNQRAYHIVEMHRERYEKATKYEKTEIAERIVTMQAGE